MMINQRSFLLTLLWLLPAALAFTSTPVLRTTSSTKLSSSTSSNNKKDSFHDFVSQDLQDLGDSLQDQMIGATSHDDALTADVQQQLVATQTQLEETRVQLAQVQEHLADLRVMYITTERELHREIRDRKLHTTSYRALLRSAWQLTQQRFQNFKKAVTSQRWRKLARSVRAHQKKQSSKE